jgi:hypothetical protein
LKNVWNECLRDEQSRVDYSQPHLRAMISCCRTRVHTFVEYFGSYAKPTNKGHPQKSKLL